VFDIRLKIPPPVQGLICLGLIWTAGRYFPIFAFNLPYQTWLAGLLVLGGFAIDIAGLLAFRKVQTTINPLRPQNASYLVIVGIYHVTRNPMYLGMLVVLLGAVVYFGNLSGFLVLPLFVFSINKLQIEPEEKTLDKLFGDSYQKYRAEVRRWI